MKIGLSFGRCIRDIVKGEVDISDVIVIIARTRMEDEESIFDVCEQYGWDVFKGLDMAECKRVAMVLYDNGKLHQPRLMGAWPGNVPEGYVWMDVVPTAKDMTPGVKDAWDTYRMLLTMCASDAIPDADGVPRS